MRTFSQFFAGPVEKDDKQMEWHAEEASTEPGSSEAASDGADTSLPADEASDGEPTACSQAAAGAGARVAEDWPVCVDTTDRRMTRIEEGDGNGERGVEFAVTADADDANVAIGGLVRKKPTPASQTADGQAKRRALKRYRQDASGQFVKGRAGDDGRWLPEPGAKTFPTLESAMEHERQKTTLRRSSWANLRGEVACARKAVTQEGVRTRHPQSREAEETRRSVEEVRDALTAKLEECVKTICAQKREDTLDSSSASKISFYSMVFSNLRAQDMKDLLKSRGIEPVGAKSMLAQLVVAHLTEEEVEQSVIGRGGKRRRIDGPIGNQSTLDALFGAGAGRTA